MEKFTSLSITYHFMSVPGPRRVPAISQNFETSESRQDINGLLQEEVEYTVCELEPVSKAHAHHAHSTPFLSFA